MTDLPILILAAGQSRRMRGRDKLLEEVDGRPLIRRMAQIARAVSGRVVVALPPAPHARYDALDGLDITALEVRDAHEGMGASIAAGTRAMGDAPAFMLLLADLPDLQVEDLNSVTQAVDLKSETAIWRGATADGAPGHPIVFRAELYPALAALSGDDGGRGVVASVGERVKLIPLPGTRARRDLDTPEDWAAWRAAR